MLNEHKQALIKSNTKFTHKCLVHLQPIKILLKQELVKTKGLDLFFRPNNSYTAAIQTQLIKKKILFSKKTIKLKLDFK